MNQSTTIHIARCVPDTALNDPGRTAKCHAATHEASFEVDQTHSRVRQTARDRPLPDLRTVRIASY